MSVSPAPLRAVIIEDDADVRGLLATIVARLGFEVTQADTGRTGIEAVRATHADLVTLDVGLPDIDGVEVCGKLREFSDAFIIMVTAKTAELDRLTGLDTGADDYITKPFSPRELQSRINALFRRARTATSDRGARDELVRAGEVQRSLLPSAPVLRDDFEVAGRFQPSGSVGGDFYDWYSTPEGLHMTFADVMGKGMGAALIAASVRAVMRSAASQRDLDSAFRKASRTIEADMDQSGSFVTMFHARLDAESGKVSYIDAGHGLALHVPAIGTVRQLESAGPPVGAWPGHEWASASMKMAPGDALAIVSDGMLDAFDSLSDLINNLDKAIREQPTAQGACDAIMRLAPKAAVSDDVTAVVILRKPGGRKNQPPLIAHTPSPAPSHA